MAKKRTYRKKNEPVLAKPKPVVPEIERKIVGYSVTFTGNQTHLSIRGIGKLHRGAEYPVTKRIYNALKNNKDFKVDIKYGD